MAATNSGESAPPEGEPAGPALQKELLRIAHMFYNYREDPIMRDLCRLAVKAAQERLISGE